MNKESDGIRWLDWWVEWEWAVYRLVGWGQSDYRGELVSSCVPSLCLTYHIVISYCCSISAGPHEFCRPFPRKFLGPPRTIKQKIKFDQKQSWTSDVQSWFQKSTWTFPRPANFLQQYELHCTPDSFSEYTEQDNCRLLSLLIYLRRKQMLRLHLSS